MPLLVRIVTRLNWDPKAGQGERPPDEVAAEDFADPDNEVSVWEVDNGRLNLTRVLATLAGSRDFADPLDYVLFDLALVTYLNIRVRSDQGNSKDTHANATWHRSLMNPSREQTLALVAKVKAAAAPDLPAARIKKKDIIPLVQQAVDNGWMRRADLSQYFQDKLTQ